MATQTMGRNPTTESITALTGPVITPVNPGVLYHSGRLNVADRSLLMVPFTADPGASDSTRQSLFPRAIGDHHTLASVARSDVVDISSYKRYKADNPSAVGGSIVAARSTLEVTRGPIRPWEWVSSASINEMSCSDFRLSCWK